jgi:hypothetical protein
VEAAYDVPTHEIAVPDVDDDVVLVQNSRFVFQKFCKLLVCRPTV